MVDIRVAAKQALSDEYEYSGFDIVYNIWKKTEINVEKSDEVLMLKHFLTGFMGRPSRRKSKLSKTIPDPLVNQILKTVLPSLTLQNLELIESGHRLSMNVENMVGIILEEYIHNTLRPFGWSCCWGNCIKAVDLCNLDGVLIQIKNRSNTENSSSSKIRQGTNIQKWYRINAYNGTTKWDSLNAMTGNHGLSEDGFFKFASKLIRENPKIIPLNEEELRVIQEKALG